MHRNSPSITEVWALADAAKNYARTHIVRSAATIENNNLSTNYFNALYFNIYLELRPYIKAAIAQDFLEDNISIKEYENIIHFSSKFSLGNGEELCLQAIDYILQFSSISAEFFYITGSGSFHSFSETEHYPFVVINRNSNSLIGNPLTWGKNCVICDPLASEIYYAADCFSKLKKCYLGVDARNHVENFDVSKHGLFVVPTFATQYLQDNRRGVYLINTFVRKTTSLTNIIKSYNAKLNVLLERLQNEYGAIGIKQAIVEKKITDVNRLIANINTIINTFNILMNNEEKTSDVFFQSAYLSPDILKDFMMAFELEQKTNCKIDYRKTKSILNPVFKKIMRDIFVETRFAKNEMEILSQNYHCKLFPDIATKKEVNTCMHSLNQTMGFKLR